MFNHSNNKYDRTIHLKTGAGSPRQGTVLCLNGNNYGGVTAAPASLALKGGGPR